VDGTLSINTKAPDFTIEANTGEKISLSDFKDSRNVLIVFYPKNNTPG